MQYLAKLNLNTTCQPLMQLTGPARIRVTPSSDVSCSDLKWTWSSHSVDGRNPANQLRLIAYPIVKVSYMLGGAGFLPSTVCTVSFAACQ